MALDLAHHILAVQGDSGKNQDASFQAITDAYKPMVSRLAYRYQWLYESSDECKRYIHELIFEALHQLSQKHEVTTDEKLSYYFKQHIRKKLDHMAWQKRHTEKELPLDESTERRIGHMRSPEEDYFFAERRCTLLALLALLPSEQRAIIVTHAVDGVTFTAIAKKLHTTPQNVQQKYKRGIIRLRSYVKKEAA